jgi:hypothetical protein
VPEKLSIVFADHNEAIRIPEREWPNQRRVDGREDGRVRANDQRERRDGCDREGGISPQRTGRETRVGDQILQPSCSPRVAMCFLEAFRSAENH